MSRRMPRKPKLKKYPKKPKQSAAPATWERYNKRIKEVDAENRTKISDYHKKCNAIKTAVKKKETIVKSLSGLGRVSRVKW